MLSELIRRHLGSLLAAVYAQDQAGRSTADQFTDLLVKLDAALGDARSGDDAAFQGLLMAVIPALRRFALSLARDATAVDDLVQETLLRAWRNRARFEPGTNFKAWTFTILRNQYYTDCRKHREVQDDAGTHAARLVSPPDQTGRLDLQDLQAGLDRLPRSRLGLGRLRRQASCVASVRAPSPERGSGGVRRRRPSATPAQSGTPLWAGVAPIDQIDCAARANPLTPRVELLDLRSVIDSEASPQGSLSHARPRWPEYHGKGHSHRLQAIIKAPDRGLFYDLGTLSCLKWHCRRNLFTCSRRLWWAATYSLS